MTQSQKQQTRQPDRFDHEHELSSFPPYWSAEVGASIEVRVLGVDRRDPEFERYVFESIQEAPIQCQRGSKNNRQTVSVQKGSEFTCSMYGGLIGLEEYAGLEVRIKCIGTREVGQPQPMYVFTIATTEETRKQLAERRTALAKAANANSGSKFPYGVNAG